MTQPPERHQQLGFLYAAQSAAMIAAPVLAGFAFALVGISLTAADELRWVDAAVAILIGAALLLIVCTQLALAARIELVSPDEEAAWWNSPVAGLNRLNAAKRWSDAAASAYNAGLVLFLDAVAVLVVPNDRVTGARWAAIGVAVVAATFETSWLVNDHLAGDRKFWTRLHGGIHLVAPAVVATCAAAAAPADQWGLAPVSLGVCAACCVSLSISKGKGVVPAALAASGAAVITALAADRSIDFVVCLIAGVVVLVTAIAYVRRESPTERTPVELIKTQTA